MNKKILNVKSLKEQVYQYLKKQIQMRKLKPGDVISLEKTSKMLGISKTPLRDALIQLEMEGFVIIEPRKGIYVNKLTIEDIREFYEIIGALEATAVINAFPKVEEKHLENMKKLNNDMKKAIENNNFNLFYKKNLEFHNIYINLSDNKTLIKTLSNLKKRLYDFPCQDNWIKQWEIDSLQDHQFIIDSLEKGNPKAAANYIIEIMWNFNHYKDYIVSYYLT